MPRYTKANASDLGLLNTQRPHTDATCRGYRHEIKLHIIAWLRRVNVVREMPTLNTILSSKNK